MRVIFLDHCIKQELNVIICIFTITYSKQETAAFSQGCAQRAARERRMIDSANNNDISTSTYRHHHCRNHSIHASQYTALRELRNSERAAATSSSLQLSRVSYVADVQKGSKGGQTICFRMRHTDKVNAGVTSSTLYGITKMTVSSHMWIQSRNKCDSGVSLKHLQIGACVYLLLVVPEPGRNLRLLLISTLMGQEARAASAKRVLDCI